MLHPRTLLACLLCLVATAAFPAVGFAQAAGDTEYSGVAGANAIAPAPPALPTSGTAAETSEGSSPAPTPATATPATAQVASETSSGTLPFTGRDVLLMLFVGIGLVGLGVVLRTTVGRATPAG